MLHALAIYALFFNDSIVVGAIIGFIIFLFIFFKLISYHMVNYWCRKRITQEEMLDKDKNTLQNINLTINENEIEHNSNVCYPDNLNIINLCYFILAPTCCYELNYPRNETIRKGFLFKRLFESVSSMYIRFFTNKF